MSGLCEPGVERCIPAPCEHCLVQPVLVGIFALYHPELGLWPLPMTKAVPSGVVLPPHSGTKADHIPGPILPSANLGNLRSQLLLIPL